MSDRTEEQIRLGLRLLADDVQPPAAIRAWFRPRRLVPVAAAFALLIAAAVFAVTYRGGGSTAPRFLADTFNYQPGGGAGGPEGPLLPYSVAQLTAAAAASAQDAWIVGSVAWHWNGTAWRNVPLPVLRKEVDLYSVAAVADGEAWVVGSHGEQSDYDAPFPLLEHWDGARWRVVHLPHIGLSSLLAVSASGPDDAWILGESFRRDRKGRFPSSGVHPLLLHWDGSTWSRVALPWARPGLVEGAKVVATAPSDVWIVAGAQIEHWDGATWQSVPAPFGARDSLLGFSATSADDAWAVGSYLHGRRSRTLAAHWDGLAWRIAPTPNRSTDSSLSDVVALSPDDAWAVGQSQWLKLDGNGRGPVVLFEHWDGRSWHIVPGPTLPIWYRSGVLAAAEDGSAWAIGSCYLDNFIARWNGSAWVAASHPPDQRWQPGWPHVGRHFPSCRPYVARRP